MKKTIVYLTIDLHIYIYIICWLLLTVMAIRATQKPRATPGASEGGKVVVRTVNGGWPCDVEEVRLRVALHGLVWNMRHRKKGQGMLQKVMTRTSFWTISFRWIEWRARSSGWCWTCVHVTISKKLWIFKASWALTLFSLLLLMVTSKSDLVIKQHGCTRYWTTIYCKWYSQSSRVGALKPWRNLIALRLEGIK